MSKKKGLKNVSTKVKNMTNIGSIKRKTSNTSRVKSTNSEVGSSQAQYQKPENILDNYFKGIDYGTGAIKKYTSQEFLMGYGWKLESILNSEGITMNRLLSKVLNTTRININHTPSPVDFTNFGKMYIFFTKPDLYLFKNNNLEINDSIKDNHSDLYMLIKRNTAAALGLQSSIGQSGAFEQGQGFNYLLSNLCNSFSMPELSMTTYQGPKNQYGFGISYIGEFSESLQEGDVEASFIDTRDRDVMIMMQIWMMYAEGVRAGTIFPKGDYIGRKMIDYACSVYTLAVDEAMNIQTFGGCVGVFPRSIPNELLNYKAEALTAQDFIGPFSYTFHVSHVLMPNTHSIVNKFNYSSGYAKIFTSKATESESSHKLMYKKKNGYWHHSGITMDVGYISSYPYHFTLFDKWAEIAGISFTVLSSGTVVYTLGFASRDMENTTKSTDFWLLNPPTPVRSRWVRGRYMRAMYDKYGNYKWIEVGEDKWEEDDGSNGAHRAYTQSFGWLNNVELYTPFSSNGSGGVYMDGWQNWNSGANRYGYASGLQGANNANVFKSVAGNLLGHLKF